MYACQIGAAPVIPVEPSRWPQWSSFGLQPEVGEVGGAEWVVELKSPSRARTAGFARSDGLRHEPEGLPTQTTLTRLGVQPSVQFAEKNSVVPVFALTRRSGRVRSPWGPKAE